MGLNLTTLELTKSFAGIPTDTTSHDIFIETLIISTSDELSTYLDRDFELKYHNETFYGDNTRDVLLNTYPVRNILYAGHSGAICGCSGNVVIDLTYSGIERPTILINDDAETLILNTDCTSSELPIAICDTVLDLSNAINLETDWTSEVSNDLYNKLPARAITEIFENTLEDSDAEYEFSILMPLNQFRLVKMTENGLYKASTTIHYGHSCVVLYQAGYELTADLPTGLQTLVARIVADYYRSSTRDLSLESEKVGDYSYKNAAGAQDIINRYSSQLQQYKNISV